jgi:trigger factor
MTVTLQRLSPVLVEFDVQVAADRVKSELDKAYSQVARSARVPGFRPGKAPRKVLSHYYGARIHSDVVQKLVDETFPNAVTEHQVQPVTRPAIETQKLVEDSVFSYKARVEVLPKIESVEYEGLAAARPKTAVADEDIDKEIEELRKSHATLEAPKTPRPAQHGDMATVDFLVEVDGEKIEDVTATDLVIELGAGQLLPEIDAGVTGKSLGESGKVEVNMPAQHPHAKLKGKKAIFEVIVKDIKEKVLPTVDDEFAKDVGDFDSLEALKNDIKGRLEKRNKEASDNQLAERLVMELVKKNPVPVPPSLVEQQMRITEQEILQRARSYGQQAQAVGDELKGQIQADSEVKVRAGLLMAEIAKKEAIQIGNDEIEEGLKELAEQTGKNVAKLRVEYRDQKKREMLIGMLLENKVLDIIEAKAKIEDEQ